MFLLDLSFWAFAAAALLCAIGAWAIAGRLVHKRIDEAFAQELDAAREKAERRVEEQTADPLRRGQRKGT